MNHKFILRQFKTKEGRYASFLFLLAYFRKYFPLFVRKKVKEKYAQRLMVTEDKCLNQGFCDHCWCKVPDMLWVKDCKGNCKYQYDNN